MNRNLFEQLVRALAYNVLQDVRYLIAELVKNIPSYKGIQFNILSETRWWNMPLTRSASIEIVWRDNTLGLFRVNVPYHLIDPKDLRIILAEKPNIIHAYKGYEFARADQNSSFMLDGYLSHELLKVELERTGHIYMDMVGDAGLFKPEGDTLHPEYYEDIDIFLNDAGWTFTKNRYSVDLHNYIVTGKYYGENIPDELLDALYLFDPRPDLEQDKYYGVWVFTITLATVVHDDIREQYKGNHWTTDIDE